ncbi:MAG: hypothetical protein BroJett011_59640 [Chloroflexota bacterium]|nr:MAG: hypothetical protein BroJett011_59640 [Chloroflexota bacterium]
MSCEKNGSKVSHTAGVAAGISLVASKLSHTVGRIRNWAAQSAATIIETAGPQVVPSTSRVAQVATEAAAQVAKVTDAASIGIGSNVAMLTNPLLKAVDRPATTIAKIIPLIPIGLIASQDIDARITVTGPHQGYQPAVIMGARLTGLSNLFRAGGAASSLIYKWFLLKKLASVGGAGLAAMATKPESKRVLIHEKSNQEVKFYKTGLTPWLNRSNLLVSPQCVISDDGDIIQFRTKLGGPKAWYRGTTMLRLPSGNEGDPEERTLTYLQSLTLPVASYYFNRPLSDEEVADIITERGDKAPHQMEGYVGSISSWENLSPGWASTKRMMILTQLHWPPTPSSSKWKAEEPATDIKRVVLKRIPKPQNPPAEVVSETIRTIWD